MYMLNKNESLLIIEKKTGLLIGEVRQYKGKSPDDDAVYFDFRSLNKEFCGDIVGYRCEHGVYSLNYFLKNIVMNHFDWQDRGKYKTVREIKLLNDMMLAGALFDVSKREAFCEDEFFKKFRFEVVNV